jgi:DNA-binding transcriptional regulator/RsmH inhibitor MraZ
MLTGSHELILDRKGRLVLPVSIAARWGSDRVALCRGANRGTLVCFPAARLPELSRQWSEDVNTALVFLAGGVAETVRDQKTGRLQLPAYLRAWAELEPGDLVAVADLGDSVLITRADLWLQRVTKAAEIVIGHRGRNGKRNRDGLLNSRKPACGGLRHG